jgi:hypothetical protein
MYRIRLQNEFSKGCLIVCAQARVIPSGFSKRGDGAAGAYHAFIHEANIILASLFFLLVRPLRREKKHKFSHISQAGHEKQIF